MPILVRFLDRAIIARVELTTVVYDCFTVVIASHVIHLIGDDGMIHLILCLKMRVLDVCNAVQETCKQHCTQRFQEEGCHIRQQDFAQLWVRHSRLCVLPHVPPPADLFEYPSHHLLTRCGRMPSDLQCVASLGDSVSTESRRREKTTAGRRCDECTRNTTFAQRTFV